MTGLAPIQFLSVCSGIEAASVAWQSFGWRAAAVSEIDPFPCHVLAHRHGAGRPLFMPDPNARGLKDKDRRARASAIKAMGTVPETGRLPNFGDMNQFKEWPSADVSLLVGGTPCQSFSVAGLRKGLDDPRGNLALTYLAIADRYRPEWVVWENVPGVLSSNGGRDFGAFLGGLVQLGYGFAYRVLDAQHVRTFSLPWAVPQRRRRLFVVGYLGDWRPAAAVLFDGQSLRGDPPPRRESGQRPAPTLSARTRGGGGLGTDFDLDGGLIPAIANPLTARMHKGVNTTMDEGQTMVAHALRGEGFDASVAQEQSVAFAENSRGELRLQGGDGQIAPQLTAGGGKPGRGQPVVATRWAIRRLTPLECERLQGFPDGYTDVPYRGRNHTPDGPRYKALGNSMARNAMEWIGHRIELVRSIQAGLAMPEYFKSEDCE